MPLDFAVVTHEVLTRSDEPPLFCLAKCTIPAIMDAQYSTHQWLFQISMKPLAKIELRPVLNRIW